MSDDKNVQFVTDDSEVVSTEEKSTEIENEGKKDVVDYATHKKLLNQVKNKSKELEELRAYKSQMEDMEAEKKGDYEKRLLTRDERIKELESKLNNYETNMIEGQKLNAVIEALPSKVKNNDYLSFVNLENIHVDRETGMVDELSLKKEVDSFVTRYGDLLDTSSSKKLPNVGSFGGRPNKKRSLKELTREELRQAYLNGEFKE